MLDDISHLRKRLLDEIESDLGAGKRQGSWTLFCCPFHDGDTHPSLGVRNDRYKCFACGASGDVFDYLKERRQLDFKEAITYLDGRLFTATPSRKQQIIQQQPKPTDPRWQSAAHAFVTLAHKHLYHAEGSSALSYLHGKRGLSDAVIQQARLGYHPGGKVAGFHKSDGKAFRTRYPCIVIPYFEEDGTTIRAIRLRQSTNEKGYKYISMPGSQISGSAYCANPFIPTRPTVITEGEFDALIVATHIGDKVNALTFGAAGATLPDAWASKLGGAVVLAMDGDIYGQTAAARMLNMLPHAQQLKFPSGKDATEFVIDHRGDLRELIHNALANDIIPPLHLSVGIASAALLCDVGAQYVAWARIKESGINTFTVADAATIGLDDKSLYRALKNDKAATVRFFAEFPTESDHLNVESQHNRGVNSSMGKSAKRWILRSISEVVQSLNHQLAQSMVTRAFPANTPDAILPPFAMIEQAIAGLSLDEGERAQLCDLLAQAITGQDETAQRRQLKQYHEWLLSAQLWLQELSLFLPSDFKNVIELRRVLARLLAESDAPKGDEAWALRLGCSRRAVRRILAGAGIRLVPNRVEVVVSATKWRQEACAAAKGKGKITTITVIDGEYIQSAPFEQASALVMAASPDAVIRAQIVCPSRVQIVGRILPYFAKRRAGKRTRRKQVRLARTVWLFDVLALVARRYGLNVRGKEALTALLQLGRAVVDKAA